MELVRTYAKELVSLAIPFVSTVLAWLSKSQPRLTYSTPHGFTFLVQEPLRNAEGQVVNPTQLVHTRSFWFRNQGRATAHKVEIVFNWKPRCVNIWPPRHFDERIEPDNRWVLGFDSLAPQEGVACELLAVNNDLPALMTVRCDEGMGRLIVMAPQPVVVRWRVRLLLVLAFIGFVAAIYLVLVTLQWLVLRTPAVL
jgi:hypothetical protein